MSSPGRQQYLRKFAEHGAAIEQACRELAIEYHPVSTERPLELALFDFLKARLHAGRQAMRTRRRAGRAG